MRWSALLGVFCAGAVALAGCSSGGASPQDSAGSDGAPAAPGYAGPEIPGLAKTPIWSQPGSTIRGVAAIGNSFAVLADVGTIHHLLLVLDAATGKQLGSVAFNLQDESMRPYFTTEVVDGAPVAVAHYLGEFPATGLQGESFGYAEIAVDSSGRQLWASTSGNGPQYAGGYLVAGQEGNFSGVPFVSVRSIKSPDGATAADFTADPLDNLFAVSGHYAVTQSQEFTPGLSELNIVRVLDLARGGAVAWSVPKDEAYVATVDDKAITERTSNQHVTVNIRDLATGTVEHSGDAGKGFACRPALDAEAATLLCLGGNSIPPSPITALNISTGQILWQQPSTRQFRSGVASHGAVYLSDADAPPGQSSFVVLDEATGQTTANNLPAGPSAITRGGIAFVESAGDWYGFHAGP